MQSIRARLNGKRQEFLDTVSQYGVWEAMHRHGFRDYIAVRKYLTEETGNENYGLSPKLGTYNRAGNQGVVQELVAAFTDYVLRKDKEIGVLKARLSQFENINRQEEMTAASEINQLVTQMRRP